MKTQLTFLILFALSVPALAETNEIEDLDPFDPHIEERLLELDQKYEKATGKSSRLELGDYLNACYGRSCPVYIEINKASQSAMLFIEGTLEAQWPVSTGMPGYTTPNFDRNPNGRIYDAYTSSSYPGGDYNGLGNMPYAVFISGGFAIHGTPKSNWSRLGSRASHGCIRLHPDNGYRFNRLVRAAGIYGTWITVR